MATNTGDIQDIRDSILIVKGRFKASSLNLFGQFLLVFKDNTSFDSYNVVVSTYSDLYDLEPHEDWIKYKEFIANAKWKGNFNAIMTNSILDQFKKFTEQMNSLKLLYTSVSEYDYNSMEAMLFDMINRVIHDKELVLETAIQEITPSEYKEASAPAAQHATEGGKEGKSPASVYDDYAIEQDAVILSVKPIVAPVKGKPTYELRVGDRLMVFIQPLSDRANYVIDLLDLREDKEIRPTPGQVIDIKSGSGKNTSTDILTLISPGVYGKFSENEKQVKLRMYDPEIDGESAIKRGKIDRKKAPDSSDASRKAGIPKGTIIMLALFAIILVLFIVLILISW